MKLYINKSIKVSPSAVNRLLKQFKLTKNIYIKSGNVDNILKMDTDKGIYFIIRNDREPIKQIKLILSKFAKAVSSKRYNQTYNE